MTNLEAGGQRLGLGGVNSADLDDALKHGSSLLVLGRKRYAVAAPGREELDDPRVRGVRDEGVEVGGRELHDVVAGSVQRVGRAGEEEHDRKGRNAEGAGEQHARGDAGSAEGMKQKK